MDLFGTEAEALSRVREMRLESIETAIGVPAKAWAGRCYEIACRAVRAKAVDGSPRYGHWLGPVAKGIRFDNSYPFQRHGWIEKGDGAIVDPTRWVFEGAQPYVYVGRNDHYDAGGNRLREFMERPCPPFMPDDQSFTVRLPAEVEGMLPPNALTSFAKESATVSFPQLVWLANLSLNRLGDFARPVYREIERVGMRALIPLDNRTAVLGEK